MSTAGAAGTAGGRRAGPAGPPPRAAPPPPPPRAGGDGRRALGRAAYGGAPGHPVVIGRDHWDGVLGSLHGDVGARDYLATHDHVVVECGDLATGRDTDTPADLT